MYQFFAKNILLAKGWATNVRFEVNKEGLIVAVNLNTSPSLEDLVLDGPVIPTISNCHSHAFQRAFAGLTERGGNHQDCFWSWREMMYRFVQLLTPEDCNVIATQAYIEMLKAGYGRVGEFHYLHNDISGHDYSDPLTMSHQVINAAESAGIRMTLLPVLYQYAGFGKQATTEAQKRFTNNLDSYQQLITALNQQYPNLTVGITPHSLRAASIEDIQLLHNEYKNTMPFHIHISEQLPEVEQCYAYSQLRPVEYLYENVPVDSSWTLIHATHLNSHEQQLILQSGAIAGICTTTEANLGDGFFPFELLSQPELNWAIGSDSHISIDPLEELRWLEYGQRLNKHQRVLLPDNESGSVGMRLWTSAVDGGNQSLAGNANGLSEGHAADFLVLNKNHPAISGLPSEFLLDSLIFSTRSGDKIKDVYVAGKRVIKEGTHPLEVETSEAYTQIISRIVTTI